VTAHGCTLRSPLTGCQVISRPCDQFSGYSKCPEASRIALVSERGTENNIVADAKKGLLANFEGHFHGSTDGVFAGKMANSEFSVLMIDY